jgi:hypothetical protein
MNRRVPPPAIYVSIYCYMCVSILLYMCPAAICVSSYCYTCLLYVPSYCYICVHTATARPHQAQLLLRPRRQLPVHAEVGRLDKQRRLATQSLLMSTINYSLCIRATSGYLCFMVLFDTVSFSSSFHHTWYLSFASALSYLRTSTTITPSWP